MKFKANLFLVLDPEGVPIVKCDTEAEAIQSGRDQAKWDTDLTRAYKVVPAQLLWEVPDPEPEKAASVESPLAPIGDGAATRKDAAAGAAPIPQHYVVGQWVTETFNHEPGDARFDAPRTGLIVDLDRAAEDLLPYKINFQDGEAFEWCAHEDLRLATAQEIARAEGAPGHE